MVDEPPRLRSSVFVLMDILGYAEMIRHSKRDGTQDEFFAKLYRSLSDARKWLEDRDLPDEFRIGRKDGFALKAFTDNIVIGWPIRDDAESEFGRAFFAVGSFQLSMTLEGFFVRGALSVGDAYVDEIAVFGNALIETYEGEKTLARDPRIILTSSAVQTVQAHLTYYAEPTAAPQVRDVLQDADGQWFINYLDCLLLAVDEVGPCTSDLLRHKAAVEEKLVSSRDTPAVWSKYAWVAGYHNFFCDLHSEHYSDEYKIDIEMFRASPALIAAERRL
jgi:hypothetical protein